MNADQPRIELAKEQQNQSKSPVDSELSSLELNKRELEERIAPSFDLGNIVGSIAKAVVPMAID